MFLNGKRKIEVFVLVLLSAVCFLSAFTIMRVKALTSSLSAEDIQGVYAVGTELVIPKGTITVGGEEYVVEPIVYYPDGSANNKSEIVLEQTGKYVLDYVVDINGTKYSQKKEFLVYDYLFVNSETGQPLKYDETTYNGYDAEGVYFSVCPGEKVVYNKIINLNEYGKEDTLIKVDAVPENPGTPEARDLYVSLVDVHDSSNYINIRIRRAMTGDGQQWLWNSYITAMYTGNKYTGLGAILYVDHANYGYGFNNGFSGDWERTCPVELRFDYENNVLYAYNSLKNTLGVVVDFNTHFDEPFNGFTTGEVKLQMWADNYATKNVLNPFNGIIFEIDGQDLTSNVADDGTVGLCRIDNVNAPIVDFGEYEKINNIPKGVVGHPYKIFDSKVYSVYGSGEVLTRVYYGYTTSCKYEVSIDHGYFVPDNEGLYTIVYSSVDKFGNVAETCVDVYAYYEYSNISVIVPGYETCVTGVLGKEINLIATDEVITTNNLGNVKLNIVAKHIDSGMVINVVDNKLLATESGEWKIIYTAVDYSGRVGCFTYVLEVGIDDEVVFEDVVDFPSYAIVNAKNHIPALSYVDYNQSDSKQYVTEIYVEKDGQKVAEITDQIFIPDEEGQYIVVYKAVSAKNIVCYKKMSIVAVDVKYNDVYNFDMSKYFYSEDIVEHRLFENYVSFLITANGTADFIRPVDAVNFEFTFNIGSTLKAASAIVILLTDINNANQQIKLTFNDVNGEVVLNINDRTEYALENYKYGGGADIGLGLKDGTLTVGGLSVKLNEFLNGSEYVGFDSLFANLSITAFTETGVVGNTDIIIKSVCQQKFFDARLTGDVVEPKIVLSDSLAGTIIIGETIKIAYAKVYDVLDPHAEASLTVLGPDGQNVKDVNGQSLFKVAVDQDYFIKIEKGGYYQILYNYVDGIGNGVVKPRGNTLLAVSREKPVIKVDGGNANVSIGESFKIYTATATGVSSNINIMAFVLGPADNMKAVKMGSSFTANVEGTYRIRYIAIDEWGNMSIAEYSVIAS